MTIEQQVKQILDTVISVNAETATDNEEKCTQTIELASHGFDFKATVEADHYGDEQSTYMSIRVHSEDANSAHYGTNPIFVNIGKEQGSLPEMIITDSNPTLFISEKENSSLDFNMAIIAIRLALLSQIKERKSEIFEKMNTLNNECDAIFKKEREESRKALQAKMDKLAEDYPRHSESDVDAMIKELESGKEIQFYVIFKQSLRAKHYTIKIENGEYLVNGKKKDQSEVMNCIVNGSRYKK